MIPFEQISAAALAHADRLLPEWFPHGKRVGHEFKVGSIRGELGESLSINLTNGKWADFASPDNKGGDLIGLRAVMHHRGDRVAAARELGAVLGITVNGTKTQFHREQPREWQPMVPPPIEVARPGDDVFAGFDVVHEYTDLLQDRATHYVGRIEARGDRRKQFVPVTYGRLNGKLGWHRRGPDAPKPLYGLNRLPGMPDATVLLCEGEKAADAAQQMFPDHVCLSWFGGVGSVEHADLSPLADRNVIIWPDADKAGVDAAAKLASRLPHACVLDVSDLQDGDDAADVSPEDPDAWLAARISQPDASSHVNDPLGVWDAGCDDYVIPPRGWLLGTIFCRRFLSSLVADGGTGKTALRVAQLISLATGRRLTGEHIFQRSRVLIVSLEDDRDELRRRVYAVLRHHGLTPADVRGWLFLAAPKGLRLAEMRDGAPVAGELETLLRSAIQHHKVDIVSIDPFIKSHGLVENDNGAIDFVCTLLAKIAIEFNCAVDLPHHTKKGTGGAGDADRGRGASSMKDAARLVYTLTPMSPEEAQQFGLSERERRSLIRLDSGKVNIARPSADAAWFRLVGVPLGNGGGIYPAGDEVQTVEPWQPPNTWEGLDHALLNHILDEIDGGMSNGSRYSDASKADDRAAWRVVIRHAPGKSEKQARDIITAWVKSGLLFREGYEDPEQRKQRTGLRVNSTKRPS